MRHTTYSQLLHRRPPCECEACRDKRAAQGIEAYKPREIDGIIIRGPDA